MLEFRVVAGNSINGANSKPHWPLYSFGERLLLHTCFDLFRLRSKLNTLWSANTFAKFISLKSFFFLSISLSVCVCSSKISRKSSVIGLRWMRIWCSCDCPNLIVQSLVYLFAIHNIWAPTARISLRRTHKHAFHVKCQNESQQRIHDLWTTMRTNKFPISLDLK